LRWPVRGLLIFLRSVPEIVWALLFVRAVGLGPAAGVLAAFAYGTLPNVASELLSYTVYRWECAIRASVVMGFVGAGGLGQQIDLSIRMFAGGEVASILLCFLILVLAADQLSRLLRWRLT
jgi:phosphonate transport system permease protein